MQKEIIISWFAADANNQVQEEHREKLTQKAEESIKRKLFVGEVAGKIHEEVQLGDNRATYEGHWSISTQTLQ